MVKKIKSVLKRILPVTIYIFVQRVEHILAALVRVEGYAARNEKLLCEQKTALTAQQKMLAEQQTELFALLRQETEKLQADLAAIKQAGTEQLSAIHAERDAMKQEAEKLQADLTAIKLAETERLSALHAERDTMKRMAEELQADLAAIKQMGTEQLSALRTEQAALKELAEEQKTLVADQNQLISDAQAGQERIVQTTAKTLRAAEESVWAAIFRDSTAQSVWLRNKTFSAGRWAIGYQALYAMYRVLNEARPKHILELGLGQSTRMIAQYAAAFDDVEHIVVEHDQDWINFFKKDFALSQRTEIVRLDREMVAYKEAETVRVFKGFAEQFAQKKFDFIFIDAPLGGDMKRYARIDVLKLLPDCLMDRFAIMLDDCERVGERHTIAEMENVLKQNRVAFHRGVYSGAKDVMIWASPDQKFLCSM